MSDEDEEYEIEAILEARVQKVGKGRQRELIWEFLIRWKGYSPDQDSWEPLKNVESGSQEALSRFLGRINTGGRDYRDLTNFQAGETFLPVGPPKGRKGKGKEKLLGKGVGHLGDEIETSSGIENPLSLQVRKRGSEDSDNMDGRSSKRSRPTLESFSSKPNFLLTEGSPAKFDSTVPEAPCPGFAQSPSSRSTMLPEQGTMEDLLNFSDIATVPVETTASVKPAMTGNAIVSSPSTQKVEQTMPLHRARTANPLVQQLPDEEAASLQSQGMNKLQGRSKQTEPLPPPRRKKPGPGRSSDGLLFKPPTLLTTHRGKLQSVKSKKKNHQRFMGTNVDGSLSLSSEIDSGFRTNKEHEFPLEPPKPGELSRLAGSVPDCDDLPEFEEVETGPPLSPAQDARLQQSANPSPPATQDSLLPADAPKVAINPTWQRPTIFGPLGLGIASDPKTKHESRQGELSTPFRIQLDSTHSLPVLLVDHVPTMPFSIPTSSQQNPPGKFYRGSYAIDILGTIRTKGSFASACLPPDSAELHATNFRQFVRRLSDDELFIAMAGQDLLAFCSSNNSLFTQRLNMSPNLLSPDTVLVTHVFINNYSAFADATIHADDTTWSQYMSVGGF